MAEAKQLVVYAAAYETVDAALADLDAIEQLHKDELIGQYDAAVIDKENGKPHVVKRMDRPHMRVIPEWFGGGTLPRKELHEAAEELTANQAGLIAVGEPTIEKGLDQALSKAAKVVKRTVEATTDQITSELQEALKGCPCRSHVLLSRWSWHVVQDRPLRAVSWADIPDLSVRVRRCPAAWQQSRRSWHRSRLRDLSPARTLAPFAYTPTALSLPSALSAWESVPYGLLCRLTCKVGCPQVTVRDRSSPRLMAR